MSKIIKISENELMEVVQKVIAEQTANDLSLTITGDFGQADKKFNLLEKFVQDFTTTVNQQLQGETPYKIRLLKKGNQVGLTTDHGKVGDSFFVKVSLKPCKEEERYYYFTCSAAIYSEAVDYRFLESEVRMHASRKAENFRSDKIYSLGSDFFDLSALGFTDLNITNPDKKYKLVMFYFAGTAPTTPDAAKETPATQEIEPKATAAPVTNTPSEKQTSAKVITNESTTKTVSGTFTSDNGDTAHNFKNLEDKLGPVLKEMYDSGINPKITELKVKISKNGNEFTTTYNATVSKSDDGKAWMGFTSRGSFGNDYKRRAGGQIDGQANKDGRSLEEKLKGIGAGELNFIKIYEDPTIQVKQYFVQFTKPNEFPPHK